VWGGRGRGGGGGGGGLGQKKKKKLCLHVLDITTILLYSDK